MKILKPTFIILLITFCFGKANAQTTDSLSVYPNPFEELATIYFEIEESDTITLEVFNSSGAVVRSFFQSTFLPSGSYNINLFGDGLAAGIYLVTLDIGSSNQIIKNVTKVGGTTNLSINETVNQFQIYPNPTTNFITIPILGNKEIIVTNLNGQVVKSIETNQHVISLSEMEAGQYIVTVLSKKNEIITTQRVLKID